MSDDRKFVDLDARPEARLTFRPTDAAAYIRAMIERIGWARHTFAAKEEVRGIRTLLAQLRTSWGMRDLDLEQIPSLRFLTGTTVFAVLFI